MKKILYRFLLIFTPLILLAFFPLSFWYWLNGTFSGDSSVQLHWFSKSLSLDKDYYYSVLDRGYIFLKRGRIPEAMEDFEHALKLRPDDFRSWEACASGLKSLEKYKLAYDYCTKAIELKQEFFRPYLLRAEILKKSGDKEYYILDESDSLLYRHGIQQGINLLSNFISVHPSFYPAYEKRANYLRESGKWELAVRDYDDVIAHNPGYYWPVYYRGVCFVHLDLKEKALNDFNAVILNDPIMADAFFERGQLFFKIGNKIDAVKDLNQAALLFKSYSRMKDYQLCLKILQDNHLSESLKSVSLRSVP